MATGPNKKMTNASAGFQAVDDIITLLTANWTPANTDNKTPIFVRDVEQINQQRVGSNDYVLVDVLTELVFPWGIYAMDWRHDIPMTIETFTSNFATASTTQYSHAEKMVNEVCRILKTNVRFSGYALSYIRDIRNNSHQVRNVYSMIIDVYFVKINP